MDAQAFTVNRPVNLTLPAARGGSGGYAYTLTADGGALPGGLMFDDAPANRVLSGTPTAAVDATILTYTVTVTDTDSNTATAIFSITIHPALMGLPAIDDQTFTAGTAITPLILPVATGGIPDLTYSLTAPGGTPADPGLPDGLTFTASTRELSGNPTTATASGGVDLVYTVTDATDAVVTQTFSITANPALTFTAAVPDAQTFTVDTGAAGVPPPNWPACPRIIPIQAPQRQKAGICRAPG